MNAELISGIDKTLNPCVNSSFVQNPPTQKRYTFEDIDTQVSVAFPATKDLKLPKNTEKFVNIKEIKQKCRDNNIHSKVERFTPPSAENWPIYIGVLILIQYVLK